MVRFSFWSYTAVWIVCMCCITAPLLSGDLLQRINSISQLGSFGDTLKTSVRLKIFEGISIGSALPSLVDIILDKVSNNSSVDIADHYQYFPMFMMMVAMGTMYLSWYEHDFMAYVYVCNFGLKTLTLTSVIAHSLSTGVIATQCKIPSFIFIFPVVGIAALDISMSYSLIFPNSFAWVIIQTMSLFTFLLSIVILAAYWFYSLWRHYQTTHCLGFDEKKELLYVVGAIILFASFISIAPKSSSGWVDANEKSLLSCCILFICVLLFLTVVPNRLLKTINEIKDNALRLKREFVRYVSHEIRSPLSVATAGLELLRSELVAHGVTQAILALLDDISFANNTAVEILNDMLHYEHIDSGTFKLELAVMPLLNIFAGRLEVYRFMASKKGIVLRIEDSIQVSDYFPTTEEVGEDGDGSLIGQQLQIATLPAMVPDNGPASTPVLYIDKFRVDQILRNLMSNAIKFTPEGGNIVMRFLRVSATTTSTDTFYPVRQLSRGVTQPVLALEDASVMKQVEGYLRIEVVDSGAGISKENQAKMFSEFTQFNRNQLQGGGGSGLGLWICKNLASLHGGSVNVRSDGEGCGSTFFVEFPIYYRSREEESTAAVDSYQLFDVATPNTPISSLTSRDMVLRRIAGEARVFPANEAGDFDTIDIENGMMPQQPRILIVDDSSANRKIVRRMVESQTNAAVLGGCTVLEADDGTTALEVMRSEAAAGRVVDFVLIDFVMVHMNGPEAVQHMRAELGYRGVVIGITGNALPEDLTYFKDHGANTVITKPLTNAKLMDAILFSRTDLRNADTGAYEI